MLDADVSAGRHGKLALLAEVILGEDGSNGASSSVTLANVQGTKKGPKIEFDPWENSDVREMLLVDDLSCTKTVSSCFQNRHQLISHSSWFVVC